MTNNKQEKIKEKGLRSAVKKMIGIDEDKIRKIVSKQFEKKIKDIMDKIVVTDEFGSIKGKGLMYRKIIYYDELKEELQNLLKDSKRDE